MDVHRIYLSTNNEDFEFLPLSLAHWILFCSTSDVLPSIIVGARRDSRETKFPRVRSSEKEMKERNKKTRPYINQSSVILQTLINQSLISKRGKFYLFRRFFIFIFSFLISKKRRTIERYRVEREFRRESTPRVRNPLDVKRRCSSSSQVVSIFETAVTVQGSPGTYLHAHTCKPLLLNAKGTRGRDSIAGYVSMGTIVNQPRGASCTLLSGSIILTRQAR